MNQKIIKTRTVCLYLEIQCLGLQVLRATQIEKTKDGLIITIPKTIDVTV